jgi:hypothetical protein
MKAFERTYVQPKACRAHQCNSHGEIDLLHEPDAEIFSLIGVEANGETYHCVPIEVDAHSAAEASKNIADERDDEAAVRPGSTPVMNRNQ